MGVVDQENFLEDLDQRIGDIVGKSPEREAASRENECRKIFLWDDFLLRGVLAHSLKIGCNSFGCGF